MQRFPNSRNHAEIFKGDERQKSREGRNEGCAFCLENLKSVLFPGHGPRKQKTSQKVKQTKQP